MHDDKRLAKGRRWFEYHCQETEDSVDAELWHHTHQYVKVLVKAPDCDTSRMYWVEFADSLGWVVFDDELLHDSSENQRPDLKVKSNRGG